MEQLVKSHRVTAVPEHGEVHFSIAGFWDAEAMQRFLEELNIACVPYVKSRQRIHAVGDMDGFVPQNAETAEKIRTHLMGSKEAGLERVAIIKPSALVKLQYRRISKGIEVEFFDSKADALAWIRR